MLHVQKYLRSGKTLDQLVKTYSIKLTFHDTEPLVILNYCQLDSPKTHPIVRECRGLVLHKETFAIVAKSFNRFFNWGEVEHEMKDFDFTDFRVDSKEDGSLILLYYYNGWQVNTKGSFGYGQAGTADCSWRELFCQAMGIGDLSDLNGKLDETGDYTYVFELASLHNKIVRIYKDPTLFLLTIVNNYIFDEQDDLQERSDRHEYHFSSVDLFAGILGVKRPEPLKFDSINKIMRYLKVRGKDEPTFEGVVIVDQYHRRWKIKTPEYLALHRMSGNGNVYLPKNLLPFVLSGEEDELLTYFPEAEEAFGQMWGIVNWEFRKLKKVWDLHKDTADQKTFALAVVPKTKFNGMLFYARKTGEALEDVWRNGLDSILKILFKKK